MGGTAPRRFGLAVACAVASFAPMAAYGAGGSSGPGATLVVGNKGEGSVSFVDLATGREVGRSDFGPAPHEIALSPDGRRIAVVAYGGAAIAIMDVASRAVTAPIALPDGARPHGIVWHANGRIYATAEGIEALAVIDPAAAADGVARVSMMSTRPPGGAAKAGSHMLAVNAAATRAWTANLNAGTVTLVDLTTGRPVREQTTGAGTEGIALSPDERTLWVSARGTGTVMRLDPDSLTIRTRIPVGTIPLRVILSPDGHHAAVSNYGDGTIAIVRTADNVVTDRLSVPGGAAAELVTLAFSPDGRRLYAALTKINRIAEFSFPEGRLLGLLAAGAQGDGLAIAPVATDPHPARPKAP